jgi:hypothetical protein
MAKFVKTPKLEIVLQLTETVLDGPDGRAWVAHDVERNRGFRVTLSSRSLQDPPPGKKALDRAFREEEIEGALGLAIERELVTPPEKVSGTLYNVALTSHDLYEFLALRG